MKWDKSVCFKILGSHLTDSRYEIWWWGGDWLAIFKNIGRACKNVCHVWLEVLFRKKDGGRKPAGNSLSQIGLV